MLTGKAKLGNGQHIKLYEEEAAKIMSNEYAVSFASGRQALIAILRSMGIKENEKILVTGFTCVAVINSILAINAIPVYIDIDTDTFSMDVKKVKKAIDQDNVRALILQHTFGIPAKYRKEIANLCDEKNIWLIEDCAHCVGVYDFDGKVLGSYGDAAFYSSDHTKGINTSTGGMALTNHKAINDNLLFQRQKQLSLIRRIQILFTFVVEVLITHHRIYWLLKPLRTFFDKSRIFFFFRDEKIGNKYEGYALTDFQSLIGISQLNKVRWFNYVRKNMTLNWNSIYRHMNLLRYPVLVEDQEIRDLVKDKLDKYYEIGVWFNSPIFGGSDDLSKYYYMQGECPLAEDISKRIYNCIITLR